MLRTVALGVMCPMDSPVIRTFQPSEWQLYRDARLCALRDSPNAFGSTYDSSILHSDRDWQDRLRNVSPRRDLPLAAFVVSGVAGMSWTKIEPVDENVAHLYQMWVAPQFRGLGISRGLLTQSIEWATERVNLLVLGVAVGYTPARKLYESAGFVPTGEVEPLRAGSELQVQTMVLSFKDNT
jgi:ribosomal protein S18 acetylase RimI-like enzyme